MRTYCHKESHYVSPVNVGWGINRVNKYNYKQYKYILCTNKNDTQKFVSSY